MLLDELLARLTELSEKSRTEAINLAVQSTATMAWVPNPGPQTQAFLCEADELFDGGEAGGRKTDLGIGLALTAHKRSLLLRRINKDAVKIKSRIEEVLGRAHTRTKAGDFELGRFEDRYENAVVEMLQRKRAGIPVPTERIAAPAPNVVSLMDALKRSLAAEEGKAPEPAAKSKKPKKRAAGQREMLLPIAGKGTAKETAKEKTKEPARPATRQRKAG